jgi:phage terminase large subunit GpA-like protein
MQLELTKASKVYRPAAARGLMPDPEYQVADWAEKHRMVAEGTSSEPGKWHNNMVPYLTEIMDCLSPSHPCTRITFLKSGQVGGSEMVTNFVGFIIDVAPGPTLIVHPTLDAAMIWDKEKLTPNIEANPRLKAKVVDNMGRQGGSTAKHKKFPGGFVALGGANSAPSLRQRSIKYLIKDDWDEWPFDVNNQGDPDKMAEARVKTYLKRGAKKFEISTPVNKSVSRVHKSYEESDQRVFKVECPQCREAQELRFFPLNESPFRGGLKFEKQAPYNAHYVCEFNGCIIEEHEKSELLGLREMVRAKTRPRPASGIQNQRALFALRAMGHCRRGLYQRQGQAARAENLL